QPGPPLNRADSAEVMKIPEPIIDPTTIIVASTGPIARTKPDGCCGPLISRIAADESRRPLSRDAIATRARNRPLRDYRRADKPSPREHRHPRHRSSALCLHATCESRAGPLPPHRATMRPAGFAEQADRYSDNFDPRKPRAQFAIRFSLPRATKQCSEAQRELIFRPHWRWRVRSPRREIRPAPPYYIMRRAV